MLPLSLEKRSVTRVSNSTPDHAVSMPAAKLISWTETSSTQLLKFGTVSQTMLLKQFYIWGSSLLNAVCIGVFFLEKGNS